MRPMRASLRLRNRLHDGDEPLDPLVLHLVRNLVRHRGRLGSLPRRIDEGERAVVAHLLDDLERLAEVVLGLAGEADDDVRREREVGDRRAQLLGEPDVALARVRSAHRFEDPRRSGLQRKMGVLADGRALRHRLDHRTAEVLGVRRREADPLDPVDGVAGAEQVAELAVRARAPRVDVLAEQRDLAHAFAASRVTSAMISPGRRETSRPRTAGTMQYAHFELQPIEICTHAWKRRSRCIGNVAAKRALVRNAEARTWDTEPTRAEPLAEMRDRSRSERDVDIRIEREEPLALRLRVAAADGDHRLRAAALLGDSVSDVGGESRVGLLADRARVEHEDVRLVTRRASPRPSPRACP